jgi:hypothetical protein
MRYYDGHWLYTHALCFFCDNCCTVCVRLESAHSSKSGMAFFPFELVLVTRQTMHTLEKAALVFPKCVPSPIAIMRRVYKPDTIRNLQRRSRYNNAFELAATNTHTISPASRFCCHPPKLYTRPPFCALFLSQAWPTSTRAHSNSSLLVGRSTAPISRPHPHHSLPSRSRRRRPVLYSLIHPPNLFPPIRPSVVHPRQRINFV